MKSITPCSHQSTEFHICLAQTNLNAIFNHALFPPLGTTLVHYNLSPINTTSCVSTMNDYSYDALPEDIDCLTESSRNLLGDISSDVPSPIQHEDANVALPNRATNALSELHPTQAKVGLRTVELPELDPPPANHRLPTVESSQNCEEYTPHLVLSILTVIQ